MNTALKSLMFLFVLQIPLMPAALAEEERNTDGGIAGQYADLKKVLESRNIQVIDHSDHLGLVLPADKTFKLGTSRAHAGAADSWNEISALIRQYDFPAIEIRAYSDDRGNAKYNQQITDKQAETMSGLLANSGIDRNRIESKGYGEDVPVADNATADGRGLNRRLELRLYPYDRSYVVAK